MLQADWKAEEIAQPAIDSHRRIEAKLDWRGVLPKAYLVQPRIKLTTQRVNTRCSLPVHDATLLVEYRVNPVLLENAPSVNGYLVQLEAIQGFNRKYKNPSDAHENIPIQDGMACNSAK